ncbi:MAG: ATP-dependent helicase [Acidimicrobiales bacterium]
MGTGSVLAVDGLLDGLTEEQRLAVTINAPKLRILAGAGSGKTRVLTRRIAHQSAGGGFDPQHALALTFTRKAAGELRHRLRQLGLRDSVAAGTFHAQAYAQLRSRWADNNVRPPELLDRRGRLLCRILPKSLSRADRLAVMTELDWATARRITAEQYPEAAELAQRRLPVTPAQLTEYYRAFVQQKKKQRLVDFDDLLELCIRDLSDPEYAKTRHWRFRHLFVDEFQDVNPLQFALLRSWLGPESTLCVVGDPNQAIYTWNGADAAYLEGFPRHFLGAETVKLTDNFRSTPQILAAAAAIRGSAGRLRANRPDGPLPTIARCADESSEAKAIARRVRDRHKPGGRWSHQAVLVRTNAQTTVIAEALRNSNIPVAIKDGASILDDPRVADRLRTLSANPTPLAAALVDLRMDAKNETDESAAETLDMLANLAEDQLALTPESSSADFVAWVRATVGTENSRAGSDAVDLLTFHASKGLEWPAVHLAGVEAGLVPIGRATTPEAAEEEVRLFYVAITRAQDELHCSWAATRRFGKRTVDRHRSPLLDQMTGTDGASQPVRSRSANAAKARKIRQELGVEEMDDGQKSLRDEIKQWRLRTARSSGVPAYVVFPDRTLDALATHRPSTPAELQQIPGLGPVKVARYADDLLEMLQSS